jgi:recombinational DNA repair ATPase RecF
MEVLKQQMGTDCLACLDDIESELDQSTLSNIYSIMEKTSSQFIITSKSCARTGEADIEIQDNSFVRK